MLRNRTVARTSLMICILFLSLSLVTDVPAHAFGGKTNSRIFFGIFRQKDEVCHRHPVATASTSFIQAFGTHWPKRSPVSDTNIRDGCLTLPGSARR